MIKYAIIESGKIINTVISDSDYALSQGWVECDQDVGIGWSYIDGQFIDERPAPDPEPAPTAPTKEDLLAQLQALQAQITALGE